MTNITLIRGLPGSGKSTVAPYFGAVASADDYMVDANGGYLFDHTRLPACHARCINKAKQALRNGHSIAIANTFSQRWEIEPYLHLGFDRVTVLDLFDGGLTDEQLAARGVHNVPEPGIARMRARWEHDWRNGNPTRPMEST